MLDPDFKKHHPAWKLAALIVDRAPSIMRAGALLFAAYNAPAALRSSVAIFAKGFL